MDIKRWKKAQEAEIEHEAHGHGYTPQSHAEAYFEQYWNTDIVELTDKRVLAVGSGTGMVHSLDIVDHGFALDPMNSQIYPELTDSLAEFVTGAGEALPFSQNEFDAVINFNVLDHTHHPDLVIEEIHRVLKPEGALYFAVNTFEIPKAIRTRLGYLDKPHPYHYSSEEIRSLITNNGFEIDHFNTTRRWSDVPFSQLLSEKSLKEIGGYLFRIHFTTAVFSIDG